MHCAFHHWVYVALTGACLGMAACRQTPRLPLAHPVDLLVIAPHPDDEVLLAGGAMHQALRDGKQVAVLLITNGDLGCERNGYEREAESMAALRSLGLPAQHLLILGYPDGALAQLGDTPMGPRAHQNPSGECVEQQGTYADASAGRIDEHRARTGKPGEWTQENLTADLAAVLARLEPQEVYVPHGIDSHPDHAMTYVFWRRALDRLPKAPRVVHRGIVHAGRCWPSCDTSLALSEVMPPLPEPLTDYRPDEAVSVDSSYKLELIQKYPSQLEPWLLTFARRNEVFFTETYVRERGRWVRPHGQWLNQNTHVFQRGAFDEISTWNERGFVELAVKPASLRN